MDVRPSIFLLFPLFLPSSPVQRLPRSPAAQQRLGEGGVSGSAALGPPGDALPQLSTAAALLFPGLLCPGHLQLFVTLLTSVSLPVFFPRLALSPVAVPALLLVVPRCLRLLRQQAGFLQLCEHSTARQRPHGTPKTQCWPSQLALCTRAVTKSLSPLTVFTLSTD